MHGSGNWINGLLAWQLFFKNIDWFNQKTHEKQSVVFEI